MCVLPHIICYVVVPWYVSFVFYHAYKVLYIVDQVGSIIT
jgi:hypothetical protein